MIVKFFQMLEREQQNNRNIKHADYLLQRVLEPYKRLRSEIPELEKKEQECREQRARIEPQIKKLEQDVEKRKKLLVEEFPRSKERIAKWANDKAERFIEYEIAGVKDGFSNACAQGLTSAHEGESPYAMAYQTVITHGLLSDPLFNKRFDENLQKRHGLKKILDDMAIRSVVMGGRVTSSVLIPSVMEQLLALISHKASHTNSKAFTRLYGELVNIGQINKLNQIPNEAFWQPGDILTNNQIEQTLESPAGRASLYGFSDFFADPYDIGHLCQDALTELLFHNDKDAYNNASSCFLHSTLPGTIDYSGVNLRDLAFALVGHKWNAGQLSVYCSTLELYTLLLKLDSDPSLSVEEAKELVTAEQCVANTPYSDAFGFAEIINALNIGYQISMFAGFEQYAEDIERNHEIGFLNCKELSAKLFLAIKSITRETGRLFWWDDILAAYAKT